MAGLLQSIACAKPASRKGLLHSRPHYEHSHWFFIHASKKKKGGKTSSNIYVDVDSLDALSGKLNELGARQVGLMCRDRTGGTRLERKMFGVPELNDEHLAWLRAKPAQFETRAFE